ncbi:MAG: hypothetical protein ACYDCI_00155 [Candidatus Limnocylindrales bacterium]
MKKPPKRLFRDRRLPVDLNQDRRRVEIGNEPVVDAPDLSRVLDLNRCLVYIPVHRFVDTDTWHCVNGLRDLGFPVHLSKGASAIDMSRSLMASEALLGGYEQLLFIDADMLFDPADAVKLFLRPEPVIAGIYAAKAVGERGKLNVDFGPDVAEVKFGPFGDEETVRPCHKVGAGFLRIKTDFLRRMVRTLKLPYCHMGHGQGWPFFQPMVVDEDNTTKYLPEDYAFCRRCVDVGEPPFVDTSIRLYHLGDYAYGLEEARGLRVPRFSHNAIEIVRPACVPLVAPDI